MVAKSRSSEIQTEASVSQDKLPEVVSLKEGTGILMPDGNLGSPLPGPASTVGFFDVVAPDVVFLGIK